jgi:hypothetical protein
MKKILGFALLLVTICACAQNKSSLIKWNVSKISTIAWNTPTGIPYIQVPGANLGATSFEIIDSNRLAFLSNASNEIIIVNKTSGDFLLRFPVSMYPRDFVFDRGLFYVLEENRITAFTETGQITDRFTFPEKYLGVERITRYNNGTYLLLPSGNSFEIGTNIEHEGWITNNGDFVTTKLNGNSYSIKITTFSGKTFEKTFKTQKKVAGVFVVGTTANRLIFDVQTFISENPVSVERSLIAIELNALGIGNITTTQRLPDCYYVLSNKDLDVASNGIIFNMISSPQGVYIFSLQETKADKALSYPVSLQKIKYHFNNHLLQVD